jgi:mannose-6-phosphate isomerase-like protein (cupin superfamily)
VIHERPWGTYEILLEEENYKVKRITVNPYQQFSLQYHNHRDEYWTVVAGDGKIILDGSEYLTSSKTFFYIPKQSVHRASANGDGLIFIEVQVGECSEEDIVRLQDDYGR